MGKLLNFDDWTLKAYSEERHRNIDKGFEDAAIIAQDLNDHFIDEPVEAVLNFNNYLLKAVEIQEKRDLIGKLSEEPYSAWTGMQLYVAGSHYQHLGQSCRTYLLKDTLAFLKLLGPYLSRENLSCIADPWYLSDIMINRPSYSPSSASYERRLRKERTWKDFAFSQEGVLSEFLLAKTVCQPRFSSLQVRRRFYDQNEALMDATLDGIAALVNDRVHRSRPEEISGVLDSQMRKYDPLLHTDIERKMDEGKWIRLYPKAS